MMMHEEHDVRSGSTTGLLAGLRTWSEVLALFAIAAFLAFSYFAGRTRFFVAGSYVWLTPATAIIVLTMAVARLRAQLRGQGGCGCGDHQPGRFSKTACMTVILVGVGFALTVNPQQYSADGVHKRRASLYARDGELENAMAWILQKALPQQTTAANSCTLSKTPTVADLLEATTTQPRSALEGEFVSVVGQCLLHGDPTQRRFEIYRLVVTCCVADATAVSVEVARNTSEAMDAGGWVSVGGILQFDSEDNSALPVIHAATVSKIAEPPSPYL
jgi:uncharacterized repeat protein (TIGR03943 family)